jgi:hypothetical protein
LWHEAGSSIRHACGLSAASAAKAAFLLPVGVRRLLAGGKAGAWGPARLALYGFGLAGAGIFTADPGRGSRPARPTSRR